MPKASPARSKKSGNGFGTTISDSKRALAKPSTSNMEESIRRRAYEIYLQEGCQDGRDQEHWLRAEAEFRGKSA